MAANKPRVYIDACYYIDLAKGVHASALDPGRQQHIPYIENLFIAANDGDIEVWASTMILSECLAVEKGQQIIPEAVQQTFTKLLTSGNTVKLAAVDYFIAERARDLRWVDGIQCGGGADMVHVATALILGCVEFITTNRKRGPLSGDAYQKLKALGLHVIEAPSTTVLPPHLVPSPLFLPGADS
jgi:hypothetical protein